MQLLRRGAPAALCILVGGYFLTHAVVGNTGLFAWREYRAERAQLDGELARMQVERAAVEQRVRLLDPQRVDPDYADELVRDQLRVVRPDEVVIDLNEAK